ncbi:hypothetical protein B0H14DRAFT_2634871 [Mycena olivaceomarginata]|nr:hypothetical protein B0H14DRAFT_2634871 [Mycena olivaceomarginata]
MYGYASAPRCTIASLRFTATYAMSSSKSAPLAIQEFHTPSARTATSSRPVGHTADSDAARDSEEDDDDNEDSAAGERGGEYERGLVHPIACSILIVRWRCGYELSWRDGECGAGGWRERVVAGKGGTGVVEREGLDGTAHRTFEVQMVAALVTSISPTSPAFLFLKNAATAVRGGSRLRTRGPGQTGGAGVADVGAGFLDDMRETRMRDGRTTRRRGKGRRRERERRSEDGPYLPLLAWLKHTIDPLITVYIHHPCDFSENTSASSNPILTQ